MYELHHELPNYLRLKNLKKLRNFRKIPEILGFDGKCPAVHRKANFWRFLVKNRKKSAVKHFIEKPVWLNFVNLSPLSKIVTIRQKQPFRGNFRKRCSENMQQIYRKTPTPKCDFNKVATPFPKNTSGGLLLHRKSYEIALQYGCSRVNLLHIFRTPFTENTYGGLHLQLLAKTTRLETSKLLPNSKGLLK